MFIIPGLPMIPPSHLVSVEPRRTNHRVSVAAPQSAPTMPGNTTARFSLAVGQTTP